MEETPSAAAGQTQLWQLAAQSSHVAIGISRWSDGTFVEVNDAFCRLFQREREGILGRTSAELGLWPRPEERARLVHLLESEGSVRAFEARYRNAAGESGDLLISARVVGEGEQCHLVGFLTEVTQQHELIEGLRVAHSRLGAVMRSTGQLVFHQDRDLRYTWVANPALGAAESELLGRTDDEIMGPEAAAPLVALKRLALETGRSQRQEVWVGHNGQRGCFDLLVEPERDAAGRVVGIVCAATDVTARAEASARAEARAVLGSAVESLSDAVAVFDAGGRLLAFNEALRRLHRFPDRASVPASFAAIDGWVEIARADGTPLAQAEWPVARALRGEVVPPSDFRLRWRGEGEGRLCQCSVTPLRDANGRQTGVVLVARDVTEDRTRGDRLRLWGEAFRQGGIELALADSASGRLLAVNAAFAARRGWHEDELVGQPVESLFAASARADQALQVRLVDRQGHVAFESIHVARDGREFPVLVDLTQTLGPDGRPLHRLACVIDISDRKAKEAQIEQLHARLQQRTRQAEEASRAKSAFLANMSHEIRTPLNAVLGMAALIGRGPLDARQADQLRKLEAAGRHLAATIGSILDLSGIEAGRVELACEPLDPLAVAGEVLQIVRQDAAAKSLRLLLHRGPLPQGLVGDPTRLRQALLNLVANAVRFTAQGSVEIRITVLDPQPAGALLRFAVLDTGPGIAPELRERLFRPFEQGDSSITRRHGGSGLGLAITRQFARLMGGDAGAESVPGQGSTFWFTARLARTAAVPAAQPEADALRALRERHAGRRVVVADDNEINLELATLLLQEAGLDVVGVHDGESALAEAARAEPVLLLLDLHMSGLGGVEVARRLRASLPHRPPIVVFTADVSLEARQQCRAAGIDDFVGKPIEADVLFAVLLHWLDEGSGERTGA